MPMSLKFGDRPPKNIWTNRNVIHRLYFQNFWMRLFKKHKPGADVNYINSDILAMMKRLDYVTEKTYLHRQSL